MAQVLKERLQTRATSHLHQPVAIGALKVELLPPAVILSDLQVRPSVTGAYTATVRRARIQPRPWPSSQGALVFAALELDGVDAILPVDMASLADAVAPMATAPSGKPATSVRRSQVWPLDIQRLSITDATVTLEQGKNWLTAAGVTVLMHPAVVKGRQVTVDVPQVAMYLPNLLQTKSPHVLGLHMQATLTGSLDHPQRLRIQAAQAHTVGIAAQLRGDIDFTPHAHVQLHGSAQAPLPSVQALLGHPMTWDGYVDVSGAITGPIHDLKRGKAM